jgi:hypothetical protein
MESTRISHTRCGIEVLWSPTATSRLVFVATQFTLDGDVSTPFSVDLVRNPDFVKRTGAPMAALFLMVTYFRFLRACPESRE